MDHQYNLKDSNDPDARMGLKTADSYFLGYKTYLEMSEENLLRLKRQE